MTPDDLPVCPPLSLAGRRALATGAGRGIGLADAAVTLVARTGTEIEAVAAALRARGDQAKALPLDVTDQAATLAAFAAQPPFDVLVNNAGTNRPKPFTDVSEADYDAVMGPNVRAAFFVAQAAVRGMVAAGWHGSIINTSSQRGHVGALAARSTARPNSRSRG